MSEYQTEPGVEIHQIKHLLDVFGPEIEHEIGAFKIVATQERGGVLRRGRVLIADGVPGDSEVFAVTLSSDHADAHLVITDAHGHSEVLA